MTDSTTELKVTSASDIDVDHEALDASIRQFAGPNGDAYVTAFHKIHNATGWMPPTFNIWAALLGPVWAAARGIWGMFWGFLFGLLFFVPILGMAMGAAFGALGGTAPSVVKSPA